MTILKYGAAKDSIVLIQQSPGASIELLLVKLLTNLTTSKEGASEVVQTETGTSESWSD